MTPEDSFDLLGSPDSVKLIWKELELDHIGDRRQKVFLFCTFASSLLPPSMRISVAVLGDSAAGKDNAVTTCIKHMPDGKAADFTRMTGSVMEDDLGNYNAIYIGEGNFQREGGANVPIIEHIKQLAEAGMHVLKKDVKTGFRETKDIRQERKTVVFSTTESGHDEELSTRFCIMTIRGSQPKTKAVNDNTLSEAASVSKSLNQLERVESPSWLKVGLAALKVPDLVIIPYAQEIPVDCRSDRSKRDLKRFLNLIRVLAFLQQKNRPWASMNGRYVIFAVPEDYLQALEIGSEIFAQSYSGLEARLLQTLETIKGLFAAGEGEEESGKTWLDRAKIQRSLGIKNRQTIARRMKGLLNLGIVEEKFLSGRHIYRLSVQSGVQYPFIPFNKIEFEEKIAKKYYQKLNGIERGCTGELNGLKYLKPSVCDLSDPEAFNAFTPPMTPPLKDGELKENTEIERPKLNALDKAEKLPSGELAREYFIKNGWTEGEIDYCLTFGLIHEVRPEIYMKV
jgi:hypothetical protein